MTMKKAKKFSIGIGITLAAVAAIVLVNKVANWFEGDAPKGDEGDEEDDRECGLKKADASLDMRNEARRARPLYGACDCVETADSECCGDSCG